MSKALLIRYLNRKCNPVELKEIERWITTDGTHADRLFEMERLWALKDEQRFSDPRKVDEEFERLWARLHPSKAPDMKPARRAWLPLLKYAAAVVFVALLAVDLYYRVSDDTDVYAENTIEVPNGQRIMLTLSDGTKVWLNAQTTFTYPTHFSRKNRVVRLKGEGFFEVATNAAKPFIVESPLLNVKVKGTKFDLKTYCSENVSVTLAEGEVEVASTDNKYVLTLKPNQQVIYSEALGMELHENVDTNLAKSWIIGELSFYDQPLKHIAASLERRFDVHICISDKALEADKFTCRFKEDVTVEQILTNLKKTKRLNYTIRGKQIAIVPYTRR